MTPAVNLLQKNKIEYKLHSYQVDSGSVSYGQAAAKALNVEETRLFKTLVVSLNGDAKNLAVGIVPVANQLDMKKFAKAAKAKTAEMSKPTIVQNSTGYVMGGVSPIGQKKLLDTIADKSLMTFLTVFVSAGKRGLQLELSPKDLVELTKAKLAEIAK